MSLSTIILLPLIAAFGLIYWGSQIKEEQPIIALIFQMMFFPLFFMSIHFAVIQATLIYASDADLVEQLANLSYYGGWVLFAVGVVYLFSVLGNIKDMILQKKQQKEQEKYGE